MNESPDRPINKPTHASGKRVLLVSALILFTGVPLLTWGTLRWVESTQPPVTPLDYTQRQSWPDRSAKKTSLHKSGFLTPPQPDVYAGIDNQPTDDEAAIAETLRPLLLNLTTLDALPDAFQGDHWLQRHALAQWQQHLGEDPTDTLTQAFRDAPKAVRLRYQNPQGQPIPQTPVGPIVFTIPRVHGSDLDTSLTLHLTQPVTDDQGCVYLPLFASPFRWTGQPAVPGYRAQYPDDEYYSFPHQTATLTVTLHPVSSAP